MIFLGVVEALVVILGSTSGAGLIIGCLDPFRALFRVLDPLNLTGGTFVSIGDDIDGICTRQLALAFITVIATIIQVRLWNPSRTLGDLATMDEKDRGIVRPARPVWNSPIIWREMMTKAYGRKVIVIKLAYLIVAAAAFYSVIKTPANSPPVLGMISPVGAAFVALSLLTMMMLVNAQGVTA